YSLVDLLARNHLRVQRQLVVCLPERLAGGILRHTGHLEEHAAAAHNSDPAVVGALTATHADFDRLLGDRLVREDADPHLAATAQCSGDGATGRLDLSRVHPAAGLRLQAKLAEGHGVSARGG